MSMSEREIQKLYKLWDEDSELREKIFGTKKKRPWYSRLWTKILCKIKK